MSTFTQTISSNQYIGDSLDTLNTNFNNINSELCNISNFLKNLDNAFGTRVVGLTSLDHSTYFSARFTETHSYTAPDHGANSIDFINVYGRTNPIYRKLTTVDYNVDSNGNLITQNANNGYYTLNSDGSVHVPQGVYTIDSECSAYYCNTHITNIINRDTEDILIEGTCEFAYNQGGPYATTYSKMHGRIKVPSVNGINIRLKQYLLSPYSGNPYGTAGLGYTYGHYGTMGYPGPQTTPNLYWAFINIQKIQDYTS
jgi:hypothetical protein